MSRSLYLFIRRVMKQIVVTIEAYHFCQLRSKFYPSRLTPYAEKIIGEHQCGFRCSRSTVGHICCIRQILEKNGNTMKQCISSL